MTNTQEKMGQFKLERELRMRILNSSREDRASVTAQAYAELFATYPTHDAVLRTDTERQRVGSRGAAMVRPLLKTGDRILEVGCGRGEVLAELAKTGIQCVGIEPSEDMIHLREDVPGVTVAWGTADALQFPAATFDLVFSQQVLEHIHPEDVPRFFSEAWRVLKLGGLLVVETPNQCTGPQDISRGFAPIAEGLHLKEWSVSEIVRQFGDAHFMNIRGPVLPPYLARQSSFLYRTCIAPAQLKCMEDAMLALIPGLELRTLIARVIGLNDIFLIGEKPHSHLP